MQWVRRFGSSVKQAPPSGLLTTPTSFGKCRVSISAFPTTLLVSRLQCVGVELPRRAEHAYPFVENHKFDSKQLGPMKQDCQPHCFSTLNHIVAYCYNDARVIRWLVKQALNRFQG